MDKKKKRPRASKQFRSWPHSFEKLRRLAYKRHLNLVKAFDAAVTEALAR